MAEVVAPNIPSCNACKSAGYQILYPAGRAQIHQIVRCDSCGLMYAYPRQVDSKRYARGADQMSALSESETSVRHANDKAPDYLGILNDLTSLGARGTLLDVGCYVGAFLRLARERGWEVRGAELDGAACAYARAEYGLDLWNRPIETVAEEIAAGELPAVSAVTMLHVIEHVDDPLGFVSAARKALQPGGILVVETPTYDSLLYHLLGRRERSLSCNGHVYFFTAATLGNILHKAGFEVIKQRKVGRTVSLGRLLWNVGVMSKSPALQRSIARLSGNLGLFESPVRLHLNMRDMIRVFARRPH